MKKPFSKYFNSRLALLFLAPIATISLGVNLTFLKTNFTNIFSNSNFSLFVFSNIKNEPWEGSKEIKKLEQVNSKRITTDYLEDVNFCGSGGCTYQVKDKQGKILIEGLSQSKPVWLESYTDGEKDLLHYGRTYPNTGLYRIIIDCYNAEKYTYDAENCQIPSLDSKFTSIEELQSLARNLLKEEII